MEFPRFKGMTANEGVELVNRIVISELKWIFREQPTDDYGIDAHIELVDKEQVTGRLIGVQIKAGSSYFDETTSTGFVYRGKAEHLNYWLNYSLPVIIVLCDVSTGICYWEHVEKEKIKRTSQKGWKIVIPKAQMLSTKSYLQLKSIAMSPGDFSARYNSLLLAKPWMDILQDGNRVIVESEEWSNKSSGKGALRIKVIDGTTGEENLHQDWPTVYFPMMPYENVFPQLFPWASISIDEDFYYDSDESEFLADWAVWDSEEDKYHIFNDFSKWRDRQPPIRPYADDGEVASYRLELTLNRLGHAFVTVEKYLHEGDTVGQDDGRLETSDPDPTEYF